MDAEKCRESALVQTNRVFLSIHCVIVILDVVGLGLLAFLVASVLKAKIFHVNLRMLIVSYAAALICRSLQTLYRSGGFVAKASSMKNECDFMYDTFECLVMSVFGVAFTLTAFCSLLASALERIYACFRSRVYEKSTNPLIGIILTLLSWISVAYLIVHFLIGNEREKFRSQKVPFCNSGTVISETHFNFGVQLVYAVLVCVVAYVGLFVYARKRKRHFSSENLSHRYQIIENLRSTQVILPVAAGLLVPSVAGIGGNYVLLRFARLDILSYAIYKELLSMILPIYVVSFPILFVLKCPELVRTWRKKRTSIVDATHLQYASSQTHFRQLESIWDTCPPPARCSAK